MKRLCYCIVMLLLLNEIYAQEISEIMYNPEGDDNNKEFIEFLLNDTKSLEGYTIADSTHNDTLRTIVYVPESRYAVIVEDGWSASSINASIYSAGATIGNNLNNEGDTITLYDNLGKKRVTVNFNNSFGNNNGKSIEFKDKKPYESKKIGGTPGKQNSIEEEENKSEETQTNTSIQHKENDTHESRVAIELILPEVLFTGVTYTTNFKITNTKKELGTINVTLWYTATQNEKVLQNESVRFNEIKNYKTAKTGKFLFTNAGKYIICGSVLHNDSWDNQSKQSICEIREVINTSTIACDVALEIKTKQQFLTEGEKLEFQMVINDTTYPFLIAYHVKDIFGEKVKGERVTSNTNTKTWTPRSEYLTSAYILAANISSLGCTDQNTINNNATALIIVKKTQDKTPMLEIKKSKKEQHETAFGETYALTVKGYRGNSTKNTISAYITKKESNQKISEISKIKIPGKYQTIETTIPIKIKENCAKQFKEGYYMIVVEGFEKAVQQEIRITEQTTCTKEQADKKEEPYQLQKFKENLAIHETFQTSVRIENQDDNEHFYTIWSYIYRGNKKYSENEQENKQRIRVEPKSDAKILLTNTANAPNGQYKFKVKIRKDEQKGVHEIIKNITIKAGNETDDQEIEEQEGNKIVSFYTHMRNPKETIKVFANIVCKKCSLILDTQRERIVKENISSEKIMFPIHLIPGKNIVTLKMKSEDATEEMKELIIYWNETEKGEVQTQELFQVPNINKQQHEKESTNTITGMVTTEKSMYSSTNEQLKQYTPYLLILILTMTIYLFKKRPTQ